MSIKFLLVLLLAAAGLAAAGMSPIRLLRADRVRSLMKKTGSDAVTIVAVIIGAECAMCERAEYDFLQLYSAFEDVPGVVFGYIDASKEPETAAMFGYRPGDVPPLLYIHNPETGLLSYSGAIDAWKLCAWLKKQVGLDITPLFVETLTAYNFNRTVFVAEQHTLVEFYAPWCGLCKHLSPHLEKAARAFKQEPSVLIGKVNAIKEATLRGRYNVSYYPTFMYFPPGGAPVEVDFTSANEIVDFFNEKAGTFRDINGKLNAKAGRILEFDAVVRGFSTLDPSVQADVLEDVEGRRATGGSYSATDANVYVTLMKAAMASGDSEKWVVDELTNLEGELARADTGPAVEAAFMKKVNVLRVLSNTEGQVSTSAQGERSSEL